MTLDKIKTRIRNHQEAARGLRDDIDRTVAAALNLEYAREIAADLLECSNQIQEQMRELGTCGECLDMAAQVHLDLNDGSSS